MHNTKLIKLLKTFSPKEIKEFGEFIHSPFFNKNKKATELADEILKTFPDLGNVSLEKENVFSILFPEEKFNDDNLRKLTSDVLGLAKQYLTIINFRRNNVNEKLHLADELNKRNSTVLAKITLAEIEKELEASYLYDEEYFYNKILFERQSYIYCEKILGGNISKLLKKYEVTDSTKALFEHFLYQLTTNHSGFVSISQNFNFDYDEKIFNGSYKLFSKQIKGNFTIQLTFLLAKMMQTKKEKYFFELEKYALDKSLFKQVPIFIRAELMVCLNNFCAEKTLAGKKQFNYNRFEIQKQIVEQKLFLQMPTRETMDIFLFIPIVDTALQIGKKEWAEWFIENYSKYLEGSVRETVVNLCKALITFEEKRFSVALKHLNEMTYFPSTIKVLHKNLLAQIFYEKREVDSLLSLLDTYRHFISNTLEFTDERKKRLLFFIQAISKLETIRIRPNAAKIKALKNDVRKNLQIKNREWLLEKIAELEKIQK